MHPQHQGLAVARHAHTGAERKQDRTPTDDNGESRDRGEQETGDDLGQRCAGPAAREQIPGERDYREADDERERLRSSAVAEALGAEWPVRDASMVDLEREDGVAEAVDEQGPSLDRRLVMAQAALWAPPRIDRAHRYADVAARFSPHGPRMPLGDTDATPQHPLGPTRRRSDERWSATAPSLDEERALNNRSSTAVR